MPFWDGDLPFEQRQSIEDYQSQVEPLVGEVITRLDALGAGEVTVAGSSKLIGCGELTKTDSKSVGQACGVGPLMSMPPNVRSPPS